MAATCCRCSTSRTRSDAGYGGRDPRRADDRAESVRRFARVLLRKLERTSVRCCGTIPRSASTGRKALRRRLRRRTLPALCSPRLIAIADSSSVNGSHPTILLTGAGGQLGRELAAALASCGTLIACDRGALDLADAQAMSRV